MEKEQSKRLTASEAKAQTIGLTVDEILMEINTATKHGDSIYLVRPTKHVSPMVISELMSLGYKCYEFKDNVIGLNGIAIDWS